MSKSGIDLGWAIRFSLPRAPTSTRAAPRHLVAANNKRHARLQILKTSCQQIEAALGL